MQLRVCICYHGEVLPEHIHHGCSSIQDAAVGAVVGGQMKWLLGHTHNGRCCNPTSILQGNQEKQCQMTCSAVAASTEQVRGAQSNSATSICKAMCMNCHPERKACVVCAYADALKVSMRKLGWVTFLL